MNTLRELRALFTSLGKEVTEFTGYSMRADGFSWGLVHDDPVRDGIVMSPLDWKAYLKALKKGQPAPALERKIDPVVAALKGQDAAIADSLGLRVAVPATKPKRIEAQLTCPWCDKTGGATGMRIHHFDRCKMKKAK